MGLDAPDNANHADINERGPYPRTWHIILNEFGFAWNCNYYLAKLARMIAWFDGLDAHYRELYLDRYAKLSENKLENYRETHKAFTPFWHNYVQPLLNDLQRLMF